MAKFSPITPREVLETVVHSPYLSTSLVLYQQEHMRISNLNILQSIPFDGVN